MSPATSPHKKPVTNPVHSGDTGSNRPLRFTPQLKHLVYTVVALGMVTSGVLNLVLYSQLNNMTIRLESLEAVFRRSPLSQLASSVASLKKHVTEQEQRFALKQDVIADIKTLSEQVLEQDRKVDQLATELGEEKKALLSQLDSTQAHQLELSGIKTSVETLQVKMEKWLSAQKKKPLGQKKSKSISPQNPQKSTRTLPLAAPFILTGIERRGGLTYAVIAPHGTTSLSQMQLLAPGNSVGGWTLRSAQGNEALFVVNGITQRLIAQ
ncbi:MULTISPECIES: hypothetical protein [Yersinia]|uniref:hypothetical protein n=1 Tax=Yersinia TaxID=629 RepID=UPI000B62A24B|nr:hypothetical protein [Yersinia kristensenii]MBW5812606.1 hypothetical protein [Yersinia kristensenii]MBW5818851.1 hypothetical protein [Yersinia kristensenii]MBW5829907.1 hypothetical protein [Yersinia kristensenii]MBW5844475.1 hypothetical protein [Yersinia kristensenii]MDA5490232.1 hypothetical protein [Yersinia kristensenii]